MPPASSSALPRLSPEVATVWNARIMPKMVPVRPSSGATAAMTVRARRRLRSRNSSCSPAAVRCFSITSCACPSLSMPAAMTRAAALSSFLHTVRASSGPPSCMAPCSFFSKPGGTTRGRRRTARRSSTTATTTSEHSAMGIIMMPPLVASSNTEGAAAWASVVCNASVMAQPPRPLVRVPPGPAIAARRSPAALAQSLWANRSCTARYCARASPTLPIAS